VRWSGSTTATGSTARIPSCSPKAAILPLLEALGFDAMTGHWDFADGSPHLKSLVSRLSYPMLAINCYENHTYCVAFVTAQGVPTKYGDNRRDLPNHAVPALRDYVERRDSVRPELRGALLPV